MDVATIFIHSQCRVAGFVKSLCSVQHSLCASSIVTEAEEPVQRIILLVHVVQVVASRICAEDDWRVLRSILRVCVTTLAQPHLCAAYCPQRLCLAATAK